METVHALPNDVDYVTIHMMKTNVIIKIYLIKDQILDSIKFDINSYCVKERTVITTERSEGVLFECIW